MTKPLDEFVILFHQVPKQADRRDHWDLMLQDQDRLLTWELASRPEVGATVRATRLPDHRLTYLDFEGPLSKNRGIVSQWEKGRFQWLTQSQSQWIVRLINRRIDWRVDINIVDQSLSISIFEFDD